MKLIIKSDNPKWNGVWDKDKVVKEILNDSTVNKSYLDVDSKEYKRDFWIRYVIEKEIGIEFLDYIKDIFCNDNNLSQRLIFNVDSITCDYYCYKLTITKDYD